MKNLLAIVGGLLVAQVAMLAPVMAEPGVSFYCGQSDDPIGKKNLPTTLVMVPGREKPLALIRWKSEYFVKYTPQERCGIVSPKFQAAYNARRLNYLATGQHKKTGQSIVCGLASEDESCEDDSNLLFTLKPYSSRDLVLRQLLGIFRGDSNNPIYQNSGDREIVDLRALLKY
jgi:Circadian oscillating protein COP23